MYFSQINTRLKSKFKLLNFQLIKLWGSIISSLFQAMYSRVSHILISSYIYIFAQTLFQMAVSRYIDEPQKKDLLLQLLQWMPGQGYVVDSSTRNLILKNSHLFGRQLIAEVLSKQHVKSKAHTNLPW